MFEVVYSDKVVAEDIPKLSKSARFLIQKAIAQRLTQDPLRYGKPLSYSYKGHRRLRVSDYRVIYRIDPEAQKVLVVAIGHRKDIYVR